MQEELSGLVLVHERMHHALEFLCDGFKLRRRRGSPPGRGTLVQLACAIHAPLFYESAHVAFGQVDLVPFAFPVVKVEDDAVPQAGRRDTIHILMPIPYVLENFTGVAVVVLVWAFSFEV